ncbi:Phosphoenolpyruvate carboxykinase [Operophtera brumata]|uniref:Phosphoenolpyruvate carboxykinase n=1 Tax=Operophtera brumata TaxID=104452 RepID=A0A0L7K2M5_OPEBR|nr:Phosphoenolpyruvate carboxykinase [Operophtera brumata]
MCQIALGCSRAAHQTALRGASKPNPQLAALTPKILLGCSHAAHQTALRGASKPNPQLAALTPKVRAFVERSAALCLPEHVHVCDGSDAEASALLSLMQQQGTLKRLPKYDNW